MRNRSLAPSASISSSMASSPLTTTVSPTRVVSATPALAVHRKLSAGAAAASRALRRAVGVLLLVPVPPSLAGPHHRPGLGVGEAAEPLQRLAHLSLLLLQLPLVGDHLPRRPGVWGARLHPVGCRLEQLDHPRLRVVALRLCHLGAQPVSWDATPHEHDVAVVTRYAAPAVGERLDRE